VTLPFLPERYKFLVFGVGALFVCLVEEGSSYSGHEFLRNPGGVLQLQSVADVFGNSNTSIEILTPEEAAAAIAVVVQP
jgi:hypothetical protein